MGVLPGAGTFFFEGSDVGCLLIHGFTGTPQNIRPLGDFLARRGLTVLAPRLAGHGASLDEFEATGPEDWIATVNTGLDQLKQSCTSVFAIGISMGGTLALHLGATRAQNSPELAVSTRRSATCPSSRQRQTILRRLLASRRRGPPMRG